MCIPTSFAATGVPFPVLRRSLSERPCYDEARRIGLLYLILLPADPLFPDCVVNAHGVGSSRVLGRDCSLAHSAGGGDGLLHAIVPGSYSDAVVAGPFSSVR